MAQERRPPDGEKDGPKLPTHPLVEALVPDPGQPADQAARLFGYPGPSSKPDATRLYLDHGLSSYVDIPNDAIRHSQTLENDQGTHVWVDPSAPLTYSTTQSHQVQADFLSGSVAQQHLAGAAAGGGAGAAAAPLPTPHVSLLPPCVTHLLGCGYSHLTPCFTHIPHCWVTETCPPSHFVPCTHLPPCAVATHTPPCPSIGIACTHFTPCVAPTHPLPCPSIGFTCTHLPPCGLITHAPPCPPSHLAPCMTVLACPTHVAPCVSTGLPCVA